MTAHSHSVLGIDTHKHTHVAVALDGLGRHQGVLTFAATDEGAAELLAWSKKHGAPMAAGIEGTGSYGYQLTRTLQAAGLTVLRSTGPTARTGVVRERAIPWMPKLPLVPSWLDRRPRSPRTAKERWNPYGH